VTSGALPAGLVLDPVTGIVSGTPTAVGSAAFTVTATNTAGTASQAFTVAVAAAAVAPASVAVSDAVLAYTGFDALPWLVAGVLIVLSGAALLVLTAKRRRRRSA
jgi:hypothetical protein